MKIALLCLSPGYGGLELYALREFEVMHQYGHECIPVVAPGSMLASRLKDSGENYHLLTKTVQTLPLLAARRLALILEQQKIDVLHIHWARDLNLAALAKRLAKRRIKLVYSRHMGITCSKRDFLHRWFYSAVDLFIANTRMVEQEANQFLPLSADRITRLYIGVAEPDPKQKDCASFFEGNVFSSRKLNLALFGRIEHGKGQHILVEAMAILARDGLDVSATIIGHIMDTSYYAKLKTDINKHNLDTRFSFIDFIEKPVQVMPCFDVIVLLTYCETFGLVLVEAMRAGVAVIGTDAGGVPEIIEHDRTGMLIPPGDAGALANAVARFCADQDLKNRLAAAGKRKADREFNDELHFKKLEQLLAANGK